MSAKALPAGCGPAPFTRPNLQHYASIVQTNAMKHIISIACLVAVVILLLAGMYMFKQGKLFNKGGAQESEASDSQSRFIHIAFEEARKVMEVSDPRSAVVKYDGSTAIVTFPFPRENSPGRPQSPGPDYLARVKIHRQTGKILEILGAP
jgi:hypothetical protein